MIADTGSAKINKIFFVAEVSFYAVMMATFALLQFWITVSEKTANVIYCLFIVVSFGYTYILELLLKKYDNAVHFKKLAKHFVSKGNPENKKPVRTGLIGVISAWVVYLLFIGSLKWAQVLSWQLFLMGASLMFLMNSVFSRKKCLLSVFFLHNKNDCCKNCGINGWDNAIFASALLFAPRMSIVSDVINTVIIICSVIMMVIWEVSYHRHPQRFYQESNKSLDCSQCLKKCKYSSK